ncbi:MAG: diguanylate cyclase [Defluviitaleaceae bacterium]|nr:diguanylate cyclase [Defluviitaleaceae bacterium]
MDAKKVILIIDDDPLMLGVLAKILSPYYSVKAASSGEAGLRIAEKYNIDLILLDVVMKDISGYEVLAKLKENSQTKDIPVIFITGRNATGDEVNALESGAVDYIRKPFVPEVVILRTRIHMQLITQTRIIERISLTDGLTGVSNRRCFDQQLEQEWNRASRNHSSLGLFMLDIDYFKKLNDTYGHAHGDLALKSIADVIVQTVKRGTDFVYRWGGEEFAVILPETPIKGALLVAEKVRLNIEGSVLKIDNKEIKMTASIGVGATVPEHGSYPHKAEAFCERIDKALYQAKTNGRNRIELAD